MDPDVVSKSISAWVIEPGVIHCQIRWQQYHMVGQHWKDQLTGRNRKKWGRIFIDFNKAEQNQRRRDATAPLKNMTGSKISAERRRELGAENIDECPGAMFIWETQEIAHPRPVCATANQNMGRDLYQALRKAVQVAMEKELNGKPPKRSQLAWWEVRFTFS